MEIIKGRVKTAIKTVIYGPEGIGKTTFASAFPHPVVFIDTEGGTRHMDVARTPAPTSWAMLMEQIKYFSGHVNEAATLVIDTADWAEKLCIEMICARAQVDGLEGFGYGKGYVYLQEEFGRMLNELTALVDRGVHVVLVAHAQMRKFEQPDEMGAYDRWEMKLSKKVAPMVKEWADMVLFANYKTIVVNTDGQGAALPDETAAALTE
ncbi:MAG: ATP-binding protein, partial [Clostridia bacterium]|nr:ATP-binding protein [Clostridia bacterium]